MTDKEKTKASKFLSLMLRHKPQAGNLTLDDNGWASCAAVLTALGHHHPGISMTDLKQIVAEDEKTRYSFGFNNTKIRANQGHSINVNVELTQKDPPEFLYHGTATNNLWAIRNAGLLPMLRQYVHLSTDLETATKVGKRHGKPHVLTVKAKLMAEAGHQFWISRNNVWLTKTVPVEFLDNQYQIE